MSPKPESAIEDLGEANMGDGNVLGEFVRWSMFNYPAERYMLVLWDHGDGWRFLDTLAIVAGPRRLWRPSENSAFAH
jgi:hypothetical protein